MSKDIDLSKLAPKERQQLFRTTCRLASSKLRRFNKNVDYDHNAEFFAESTLKQAMALHKPFANQGKSAK